MDLNLRNVVLGILGLIVLVAVLLKSCSCITCTRSFPSYNEDHPPPASTPSSDVFALSQDYPETLPTDSLGGWPSIDYASDPEGYAAAVLAYCLEGNVAVDFRVQQNSVRDWYHAPWLHWGENGREWHHGLTRERGSEAGDLHPDQASKVFNWAVGFYNARGGYTIGKVWPECGFPPVPANAVFPEGTVSFKLLFTSATTTQVPYLTNAFEWTANTGPPNGSGASPGDPGWIPRTDGTMRLLQVDIAVKDARSPIGWVFGTFVHDAAQAGNTPWERLHLVGLSWGNDPGNQSMMNKTEAFANPSLTESWIDADLLGDANTPINPPTAARVYHLGLGGRLNGPVDNPISSCTSCHGKAAVLADPAPDPITLQGFRPRMFATGSVAQMNNLRFGDYFGDNPPAGAPTVSYNCFVAGIEPNCSGPNPTTDFIRTDYSLQLAYGIRFYYRALHGAAADFLEQQNTR